MPLNNFGVVVSERIYRSAQPDAHGFKTLRALGVDLIVKLNPESGSAAAEVAQGFEVFTPEITMVQRLLNRPTAKELALTADMIAGALVTSKVVLVHCQHGRDWTGAVCAAYRVLHEGWTAGDALAEFRLFGATGLIGLYDHEIDEVICSLETRPQ